MPDDRKQMTEGRGQKAEDRRQRAEDRGPTFALRASEGKQTSADRCQMTQVEDF